MTKPAIYGDHRRANALICHYGRENLAGVVEILAEAAEAKRTLGLIAAVLDVHRHVVTLLLTTDGLACLAAMIAAAAESEDPDIAAAARLIEAHSEQDERAAQAVIDEAAAADRVTDLIVAVLRTFAHTVPPMYSPFGIEVLAQNIMHFAAREGDTAE